MKHTPTPWEIDGIAIRSAGPDGQQIALCDINVRRQIGGYEQVHERAEANAEFIVRACNAHDELVAALQNFVNGAQTNAITSYQCETMANAMCKALSALAKARKEA